MLRLFICVIDYLFDDLKKGLEFVLIGLLKGQGTRKKKT
jgi:hypothetical protein